MCEEHCVLPTWTPFNDDGTIKPELVGDIVTPLKVDNEDNDIGSFKETIAPGMFKRSFRRMIGD